MFSRNRPSGPGTRVYMRATANPGGVGHAWVKDRFITAAPPETPITEERTILDPDGKKIQVKRKRIFIPSSVFDNKKLLENDPYYLDNLAMLPEAESKALLYGSWDSFSGQVFKEWRNDPEHYKDRKWTHVIEPFRIPSYWLSLIHILIRLYGWSFEDEEEEKVVDGSHEFYEEESGT